MSEPTSTFTRQHRIFYFLFLCITIRTLFVVMSLNMPKKYFRLFGTFTLGIGLTMLYLYISNRRLDAPEGGGTTWWARYRWIHGLLYVIASLYLLSGNRTAYVPLTIDVIIGLVLFSRQHLS